MDPGAARQPTLDDGSGEEEYDPAVDASFVAKCVDEAAAQDDDGSVDELSQCFAAMVSATPVMYPTEPNVGAGALRKGGGPRLARREKKQLLKQATGESLRWSQFKASGSRDKVPRPSNCTRAQQVHEDEGSAAGVFGKKVEFSFAGKTKGSGGTNGKRGGWDQADNSSSAGWDGQARSPVAGGWDSGGGWDQNIPPSESELEPEPELKAPCDGGSSSPSCSDSTVEPFLIVDCSPDSSLFTGKKLSVGVASGFISIGRRGTSIKQGKGSAASVAAPTITIRDSEMSKHHAQLGVNRVDGTLWLADAGSNNGTFINGARLSASREWSHPPRQLRTGDKVRMGRTEFTTAVPEPPPSPPLQPAVPGQPAERTSNEQIIQPADGGLLAAPPGLMMQPPPIGGAPGGLAPHTNAATLGTPAGYVMQLPVAPTAARAPEPVLAVIDTNCLIDEGEMRLVRSSC